MLPGLPLFCIPSLQQKFSSAYQASTRTILTSFEARFGINADFCSWLCMQLELPFLATPVPSFCSIKSFTNTCSVPFDEMPASNRVCMQILIE